MNMDDRRNLPQDRTPLLAAWPQYEGSPNAARLGALTRRMKHQAWLHFAVWLRDRHPEIADVADVTRRVAEEYLRCFQDGHTAMTCNLRLYQMREMFRVILGDRGIDGNPWNFAPARAHDGHSRRELTIDEVRRLMAAAGAMGDEWRTLFLIAVCTGLRLGDCCRLRWEQVDLAHGIIQLVPHKTRHSACGQPVTIPIHRQLFDKLAETVAVRRSGAVLPTIAANFIARRSLVSRVLARIFAAAKIVTSVRLEGRRRRTPDKTFHSLRHSFVSFAANAGVPLVVVQAIVGHASTAMTRHYYHANECALRQAVDAVPFFGEDGAGGDRSDAAAGARSSAGRVTCRRRHTVAFRLKQLEAMRAKGLVNAEEFADLRREILAQL